MFTSGSPACPWRAGCGATRTSGSEGGLGKRTGREAGTAPQVDPYSVGVVCPPGSPVVDDKEVRQVPRRIGLDVHRDFAQVAIWEDSLVRQAGRIDATPEALRLLPSAMGVGARRRGCSRRTSARAARSAGRRSAGRSPPAGSCARCARSPQAGRRARRRTGAPGAAAPPVRVRAADGERRCRGQPGGLKGGAPGAVAGAYEGVVRPAGGVRAPTSARRRSGSRRRGRSPAASRTSAALGRPRRSRRAWRR
jgi:hypothetical protein